MLARYWAAGRLAFKNWLLRCRVMAGAGCARWVVHSMVHSLARRVGGDVSVSAGRILGLSGMQELVHPLGILVVQGDLFWSLVRERPREPGCGQHGGCWFSDDGLHHPYLQGADW